MIRIMPDMQVSPLGGIILWAIIIVAVGGALLTLGGGGAAVWIIGTILFFAVIYWVLAKAGSAIF